MMKGQYCSNNVIPNLTICTSYYAALHGMTKEPETGSHAASWGCGSADGGDTTPVAALAIEDENHLHHGTSFWGLYCL